MVSSACTINSSPDVIRRSSGRNLFDDWFIVIGDAMTYFLIGHFSSNIYSTADRFFIHKIDTTYATRSFIIFKREQTMFVEGKKDENWRRL